MSEQRTTPPWLPVVAGLAFVALFGLVLGPERVLRVASGVVRAPQAGDLLPSAAWSLVRMAGAYAASLLFAWVAGYTAATRPGAARVILPLLDVGQSVPVLGFFPAAIYLFITLLGGGRLSLELAAIFLIFTSQVWNLAFAVYERLSTIPLETRAAADSLGLRGVLRLRALSIPACIPALLYKGPQEAELLRKALRKGETEAARGSDETEKEGAAVLVPAEGAAFVQRPQAPPEFHRRRRFRSTRVLRFSYC